MLHPLRLCTFRMHILHGYSNLYNYIFTMQLIFLFQLLFLFIYLFLIYPLGEFNVYMYQHYSVEDLCPLLCL